MLIHKVASVVFALAGCFILIRAFAAKQFFLAPLGSRQVGPRVPNWLARPVVFLIGLGALALAVGLWRQT
jgi:hypothetical protein